MSHKAVQNGAIRHQQVTINILQRFRYITFATADMDAYKSSSNDNALSIMRQLRFSCKHVFATTSSRRSVCLGSTIIDEQVVKDSRTT